ncbi:hypothetical protein DNI29_19525 [Hymenobacter sediminis]|uniref:hypothetical protein n=1 Tax=Hymenobacter sediminis TaxID=2218621 RepID=UPI000DA64672|nr:hypothetical protein [Hymenobacter sediminis]RPD44893.1 hypothetical protein DNI29_19525 [Hymenobacter sediminis]
MNSFENQAGILQPMAAGYVSLVWHPGPAPQEAIQQAFEQLRLLLQQTGYQRLFTDHRLLSAYEDELIGWLLIDWLPRVVPTRLLLRVAMLTSFSLAVRPQAAYLLREAQLRYNLSSRYFAAEQQADALDWLLQPLPPAASDGRL